MKALLKIATLFWGLQSASIFAHGGEDHGAEGAAAVPTAVGSYLTLTSTPDTFEVFIKYAPAPSGEPTKARLFFSSYRTNVPVDPRSVLLTSGSRTKIISQPRKLSSGIYEFTLDFDGDSSSILTLEFNVGEQVGTSVGPFYSEEYAQAHFGINIQVEQEGPPIIWFLVIALVLAILVLLILRMRSRKRTKTTHKPADYNEKK